MNLDLFFKSIITLDNTMIIICDLNHKIVYLNDIAKKTYDKKGVDLLGKSILDCHNDDSKEKIKRVVNWFLADKNNNRIHTFYNEKQNKDVYMIAIRDENNNLIGYYEKHEFRTKDLTPFYDFK